jgi:hypothetical protein
MELRELSDRISRVRIQDVKFYIRYSRTVYVIARVTLVLDDKTRSFSFSKSRTIKYKGLNLNAVAYNVLRLAAGASQPTIKNTKAYNTLIHKSSEFIGAISTKELKFNKSKKMQSLIKKRSNEYENERVLSEIETAFQKAAYRKIHINKILHVWKKVTNEQKTEELLNL